MLPKTRPQIRHLDFSIIGKILFIIPGILSGMWVVLGDLPSHPLRMTLTLGALIAGLLLLILEKKPEWAIVGAVFLLPFFQAQAALKMVYVGSMIGAAVWLALNAKMKLKLRLEHYVVFAFIGYLTIIALAVPVLPVPFDSGSSLEELVRQISNLLLFLAVASVARKKPWMRRIIIGLFLSAVIAALIGIFKVGKPVMLSSAQEIALRVELQQGRAFSTLGHPNLNGQFSSLTLLILVGVWTQMPRNRWRIWLGVGICLVFINLVLSGSRGALFGFGFGLLVTWLLVGRKGRYKMVAWALRLGVVSSPLVFMALRTERWSRPIKRLMLSLDTSAIFEELSVRPDLWRVTWDAFLSSPLWGVGPINLSYHYYYSSIVLGRINVEYLRLLQAHNLYLQFLGTTGIIGTFALLVIFVTYLRRGYIGSRALPQGFVRGVVVGASSALACILVMGLVQTVLGKAWSTWQLFFIILGLLGSCSVKEPSENSATESQDPVITQ